MPAPSFSGFPSTAFTVEMWIKPKPEIEGYPDSFLLDNRYVDESGMQLILGGVHYLTDGEAVNIASEAEVN